MDKILILDIDGTLIGDNDGNIYPRPHLKTFLDFCFKKFKHVSIWTAADKSWADKVMAAIKKHMPENQEFYFIWAGDKCTYSLVKNAEDGEFYSKYTKIKTLKKVWRKYKHINKYNTLIIDDTPETYCKNYGNAIPIKTYIYDRDDNFDEEFIKLIKILENIMNYENVRHIKFHDKNY